MNTADGGGGGEKWDSSRSYITKHRAEGQHGLLLERAALLALERLPIYTHSAD